MQYRQNTELHWHPHHTVWNRREANSYLEIKYIDNFISFSLYLVSLIDRNYETHNAMQHKIVSNKIALFIECQLTKSKDHLGTGRRVRIQQKYSLCCIALLGIWIQRMIKKFGRWDSWIVTVVLVNELICSDNINLNTLFSFQYGHFKTFFLLLVFVCPLNQTWATPHLDMKPWLTVTALPRCSLIAACAMDSGAWLRGPARDGVSIS